MKQFMILFAVAIGMTSAHAAEPVKGSMSAAVMPASGTQPALHPGKPVTTAVIPGSLPAATPPATPPEAAAVKKMAPATPPGTGQAPAAGLK